MRRLFISIIFTLNFAAGQGTPPVLAGVSGMSSASEYRGENDPLITIVPETLTFRAIQFKTNPASQTIELTNTGAGLLNWSISTDMPWWLSFGPPDSGDGNSQIIRIAVTTTGLSGGTHYAQLIVTSTNAVNSPQTCSVAYTLTNETPANVSGLVYDKTTGAGLGWVNVGLLDTTSEVPRYITASAAPAGEFSFQNIVPGTYDVEYLLYGYETQVIAAVNIDTGSNTLAAVQLAPMPSECCFGTTGNVNGVGTIDLSDLSMLVGFLVSFPPPSLTCPAEANVNGVGMLDIADLSLLVGYLTIIPPPSLPPCLARQMNQ